MFEWSAFVLKDQIIFGVIKKEIANLLTTGHNTAHCEVVDLLFSTNVHSTLLGLCLGLITVVKNIKSKLNRLNPLYHES